MIRAMTHETPEPHSADSAVNTGRRTALFASVAAGAALTGAGLAWWMQPRSATQVTDPFPADLWAARFSTPDGAPLALADYRGKPLVLNFWATWCPPCIEEMPLLDRFYRENSAKSWTVLGLAVDRQASVTRFLKERSVAFPIAMAQDEGMAIGQRLGNLSGGLPFTVVIGRDGGVIQRKMGRLAERDIAAWVA